MIQIEDKDTGAILYKKEPYEKRLDQLLERVARLEKQVQVLTVCVDTALAQALHLDDN